MKIDFHSHYAPREYFELLLNRQGYPTVKYRDGGYYVSFAEGRGYPVVTKTYDIKEKLQDMDEAGVDVQVLSIFATGAHMVEPELGMALAKTANDVMAEVCQQHPDRFIGLATLPLQDTELTLKELDRAVNVLGLRGAMLFSNVNGKPLDAPELWPLYERAEQLNVPLLLHPTFPVMMNAMLDYGLFQVVGFLFDTTLAICRIILSGVLEKYPKLKIVLAHLGSTVPYILARVDKESGRVPGGRGNIQRLPSEYFKQVYIDTVSLHQPALKCAYETMGPDRIIYGSDYPSWEIPSSVSILEEWNIPKEDKEKVFHGNARKLLKLG